MTDSESNQQHQQGPADAFAAVVREHVDWVYSAAKRKVIDPQLAEDVTQAVFITLARKRPQLRKGPLSPWLFGTLLRTCKAALRARATRRRHETEAAKMRPQTLESPADAQWSDIAPHLEEMVNKLRSSDREIVLLRFYEQKSFAEIAETIGITEDAARKRVSRSVEALRSMLSRRGVSMPALALGAALIGDVVTPAPAAVLTAAIHAAAGNASGLAFAFGKGAVTMGAMTHGKISALAVILVLALIIGGTAIIRGSRSAESAIRTLHPSTTLAELRLPAFEISSVAPLAVKEGAGAYPIGEIVGTLTTNLQRISSYSATYESRFAATTTRYVSGYFALRRVAGNPPSSFDQFCFKEDLYADQAALNNRQPEEQTWAAFDGTTASISTVRFRRDGLRSASGEILAAPDWRFMGRGLTVPSIATHFLDVAPVDRVVNNGSFRVVGTSSVDDHDVAVIYGVQAYREDGERARFGSPGMYIKLFLRPDKGFMPVRQEWYAVNSETPQGRLIEVYHAEFCEIQSGIWFPTQGESISMRDDKIVARAALKVAGVEVNPRLSDDDFRITTWPPGTSVVDQVHQRSFTVPRR